MSLKYTLKVINFKIFKERSLKIINLYFDVFRSIDAIDDVINYLKNLPFRPLKIIEYLK